MPSSICGFVPSLGLVAQRRQPDACALEPSVGGKAHLEAKGIPYSDWGERAVNGWHQIFFYDPDGNVIEVHQVDQN